jgi:hypothetical protein
MGCKVRNLAKLGSVLAWSCWGLHSQPLSTASCGIKLTVRMYNLAGVDSNILSRAQSDADRAFKQAGIELNWVPCPFSPVHEGPESSCDSFLNLAWTKITIVPKSMVNRQQLSYAVFGLTLPTGVVVFSKKVREFARWYGFPESEVLSMVLAHELGHVLLGKHHETSGLMRADLYPNDLRSFMSGTLRFTREDASLMQLQLRSRRRPMDQALVPLHVPELASRECGASVW